MSIKERGIVRIQLPSSQKARLGGTIYVLGLAENLLSLEALHLTGYESRGLLWGYELIRNSKVIAYGKQVGWSTYLDAVKHRDALFAGPDVAKRMQYTWLALSADKVMAKKQELVH